MIYRHSTVLAPIRQPTGWPYRECLFVPSGRRLGISCAVRFYQTLDMLGSIKLFGRIAAAPSPDRFGTVDTFTCSVR